MQPKIISINSVWSHTLESIQVLGLADNGKMYIWHYDANKWLKFSK